MYQHKNDNGLKREPQPDAQGGRHQMAVRILTGSDVVELLSLAAAITAGNSSWLGTQPHLEESTCDTD